MGSEMDLCARSTMFVASWIISTFYLILLLQDQVKCLSIEKAIINAAPKGEMFDVFHLMPKGNVMVMTEFDLLLTMEQFKNLRRSPHASRGKRKAIRDRDTRWTGCKVYYEITGSLNSTDNRKLIKEAMKEWETYSCLYFVECSVAVHRVQFQNGDGCYSQLGMQPEPQVLVLAPGCLSKGIIVHEIGHAIGWYHEHMRPDRDDFINVNFDAIPALYKPNFDKYDSDVINTYGVPYDYLSIMHYGSSALPKSITTLDSKYQDRIGQRQGMTFKDIKAANLMYNCSMGCPEKTCPYNGFVLSKEYQGSAKCECWCDNEILGDPLILCSSLDKEPDRPEIKPTVRPTTKYCYDVREDCAELKLNNSAICMNKMTLMMASCAKTCDFCDKGKGMCMDYEKGCPILAASGACTDEVMKQLMDKLCPASCGICEPTAPCIIQHEMMVQPIKSGISQKKTWMFNYVLALLCTCLRRCL